MSALACAHLEAREEVEVLQGFGLSEEQISSVGKLPPAPFDLLSIAKRLRST